MRVESGPWAQAGRPASSERKSSRMASRGPMDGAGGEASAGPASTVGATGAGNGGAGDGSGAASRGDGVAGGAVGAAGREHATAATTRLAAILIARLGGPAGLPVDIPRAAISPARVIPVGVYAKPEGRWLPTSARQTAP